MKKLSLMMPPALLILLAAGCGSEDSYSVGNEWLSWNDGMKLAAKTERPVVIDFYTSWCRWCKVMDRQTFSDPKIASYLSSHFVSIRVNAERQSGALEYAGRTYTPAGLARAFRLRGYPSLAYLDKDGKLIFVDPGFKKPKQLMTVLEYVTSGCWEKNVTLADFARSGGCN